MPRVVIESPFQACEENLAYARRCLADSLGRGEAPYASHLLYPQLLDDTVPDQRRLGMHAGFAWGLAAELVAVYVDRGFTSGMAEGVRRALGPRPGNGAPPVLFRSIGEGPYVGAARCRACDLMVDETRLCLSRSMALFGRGPLAAGEKVGVRAEVYAFSHLVETGQTARVALDHRSVDGLAVGGYIGNAFLDVAAGALDHLTGRSARDVVVVLLRAPEAAP